MGPGGPQCVEGVGLGLTPVPGIPGPGDTPRRQPQHDLPAGVPVPLRASWLPCLILVPQVSSLPGDWAWQGRAPACWRWGLVSARTSALTTSHPRQPFTQEGLGPPCPGPGVTSTLTPWVTRVSPPASKPLTPASSCPSSDPCLGNSASCASPGSSSPQAPFAPGRRHEGQPAARTAQKSLEMSYLCSDHGGSR